MIGSNRWTTDIKGLRDIRFHGLLQCWIRLAREGHLEQVASNGNYLRLASLRILELMNVVLDPLD